MSIQTEQATQDDLLTAYREGLFSFDELMEAVGPDLGALVEVSPETAIRMVSMFGGTEVWVPVSANERGRLCEHLDSTDAQTVIDIYERCRLKVPKLQGLKRALRRRKVAALREKGWTLAELARHFGVTDRQILNILKRHRETLE